MTQKWQYTTDEGELVEFKCRPVVVGNGAVLETGPNKGKYLGVVALTDCPDDPDAEDGTICVIDGEVFATKDEARAWARERCLYWGTHHGAKPIGPVESLKITMALMVADQLVEMVRSLPPDEREETLQELIGGFGRIEENGRGEFANDGKDMKPFDPEDPENTPDVLEHITAAKKQSADPDQVLTFDSPQELGRWLRERVASHG